MNCSFHYLAMGVRRPRRKLDGVKRALFSRLLKARGLRCLFTIDETLYDHVQARYPEASGLLQYVSDPVDLEGEGSRQVIRERMGIPPDSVVLLVFGVLAARKGIDVLLDATCDDIFPHRVVLLLAGPQDPEVRELLAGPVAQSLRAEGRLFERDRFQADQEEFEAFLAADIVWVGYRAFYGMSAVMIQAGAMGRPVLATDQGMIGWMTERYGLGPVVAVERAGDVALVIAGLADEPALIERYANNGRSLATHHTGRDFARQVCEALVGAVEAAIPGQPFRKENRLMGPNQ